MKRGVREGRRREARRRLARRREARRREARRRRRRRKRGRLDNEAIHATPVAFGAVLLEIPFSHLRVPKPLLMPNEENVR